MGRVLINLVENAGKVHIDLKTAAQFAMKVEAIEKHNYDKFIRLMETSKEDAEQVLLRDPYSLWILPDKTRIKKFEKSFEAMVDFFLAAQIKWDEESADLKRSFLKLVEETKAYVNAVTEDLQNLLRIGTIATGIGSLVEWRTSFFTKIFKLAIKYFRVFQNLTQPFLQNLVNIGRLMFPAVEVAVMEAIVYAQVVGFALYLGYRLCPVIMDMFRSAVVYLQKIMLDDNTALYYKEFLQLFKTVDPNFVPLQLLNLISN